MKKPFCHHSSLILLGIATFISCSTSSLYAANPLEHYPLVRQVLIMPAQEEVVALTLDRIIWEASPGSPPDIRIADEANTPIPHLLRKAGEQRLQTVRDYCRSTVHALQEFPDNRIELTVTLDEKAPFANGIEFITPLKDFERQITVQGIDPQNNRATLVEDALIYDYTRFADVRRTHIDLPQNRFRQFNITIANVTDEKQSPQRQISRTFEQDEEVRLVDQSTVTTRPFRMDQVRLYNDRQTESHTVEQKVAIPLQSWTPIQAPRNSQSILEIETYNEPINGFTLQIDNRNFTRRISVQVPVGNSNTANWRTIGSTAISRIAFRNILHENLHVTIPEHRSQRFRLVIENQDNPPLTISAAQATGPVWQALYIAAPNQQTTLFFGAPTPKPAHYDTTAIQRVIDNGFTPLTGGLDEPQENPLYRKPGFTITNFIGSKAFFIVAVMIMVGVLAIALTRATRSLNKPD